MAYLDLIKGQDEETYKKYAQKGIDLIYPVSINGETHRPDIGVRYHNSIKVFDADKDNKDHIHEKASQLNLNPPDPKDVQIEPTTLQGRGGYKMHVIRLHGPHAEQTQQHNAHFNGMGFEQNYVFHPHITVDENTWNRIRLSGAKTAEEAGIKFHNAELRHGPAVVQTYHPKLAASEDAKKVHTELKPCTSCGHKLTTENAKFIGTQHWPRHPSQDLYNCPKCDSTITMPAKHPEKMEKGLKHAVAGMAVAAGLAGSPAAQAPAAPKSATQQQTSIAPNANTYSSKRMLNTIQSVESSNGKLENHAELTRGPDAGEHAFGKYGLTPSIIRETVHLNPDLKRHKKIQNLQGTDLIHYMEDNPGLEDTIATKHLARLEHHFGQNPNAIGYAWLNGIRGTYKAQKQKKDLGSHWHVKKINEAYAKEK